MKTVHMDESGNTGAALVDLAQPVFVLSSLDFESAEAAELLECVQTRQTREVKFSTLRKTETGQRKLVDFFLQRPIEASRIKTAIFHKKFMVVTKLVDVILETMMHHDGIDLYKNGGNIALSNLHFALMPAFCGMDRFSQLLDSFVQFIRKRDNISRETFFFHVWQLRESSIDKEYKTMLAPFAAAEQSIDSMLSNIDRNALDPAIPAFFSLCVSWGAQFNCDFEAIHDNSKPLAEYMEYLNLFMDQRIPETEIGYDKRKFVFPLKCRRLTFGDSHLSPQLQMADLIAGASAHLWSSVASNKLDDFAIKLRDVAMLERFPICMVWPTKDVSPSQLGTTEEGGINAANFITDAIQSIRTGAEL